MSCMWVTEMAERTEGVPAPTDLSKRDGNVTPIENPIVAAVFDSAPYPAPTGVPRVRAGFRRKRG